jgi:hypothetical protein
VNETERKNDFLMMKLDPIRPATPIQELAKKKTLDDIKECEPIEEPAGNKTQPIPSPESQTPDTKNQSASEKEDEKQIDEQESNNI